LNDRSGGIQAVHARHDQIENGDIRLERLHQLDSFETIGGGAEHLKSFVLEQRAAAIAHHRMVVGNDEAQSHESSPTYVCVGDRFV
jgi:hypothetical protein